MTRFLWFILCLCASSLSAQRGVEVGGHVGISHYFGDLNPTYTLSDPGFSFGLKFRRNFNERIGISVGLDYGRIAGSDNDSNNNFERNRNLDFHSNVYDANFTLEFNFFPYLHGSRDYYYTPYIFAGFSVFKFNPQTERNGTSYDLRDFGTEGQIVGDEYFLVNTALVYGIGFKWDYNRDWSFNVSLSGRRPSSDYIDDVSQNYPNYRALAADRGEIAVTLSNPSTDPSFARPESQRGNGKNNDSIYFVSFGILRYFSKLRCPPITKRKL